jgi:hypothetical protein
MAPSFVKYLLAITLCLSTLNTFSQRKVVNFTEVSGLIHQNNTVGDNSTFNGFRTRTGFTRIIQQNYGLGIALGTDNYRKNSGANYNTLPLTLTAAYFFNPELTGLKADIYGGYAVKLFNNLNRGLTAGAGLSYSVAVSQNMNVGLQTGYNYQQIDFPSTFFQESFHLGSYRIGLGITFK